MRNNAWQVTAIIAIILVVVLLIPLVIMGRDHQNKTEGTKQAQQAERAAAQKAATLEGENRDLKTLIGVPDTTALDELRKKHAEIMGKALPGENDSTRTYHDALATLLEDLDREKKFHGDTSNLYAQRQSELNYTNEQNQAAKDLFNKEVAAVDAKRKEQESQFVEHTLVHNQKMKEAQDQQNLTLSNSERTRYELTNQMQLLTNDNRDIRETNIGLAEMLEDIRNPNVEHPAGKIISVNQHAGTAIVNLGSADGLGVRTMFNVYPSSITGVTFRTAHAGSDSVYCDVCRREMSRDVAKASVEVMQILGQHRAEVRILDDILQVPIMAGDVVYSPIWKPGQKMRFALGAGVFLPSSGDEPGVEAMIRLIEMNGGVVDCWIDENANVADGEDYLKGSLSDLTNYFVINESVARALEPELARVQQALIENAKNRAIKTISLEDLLSRMRWKNVTPVYSFGSRTFEPEMRVVPQQQGRLTQSNGAVSPAFTSYNADARVNARDANSARNSNGVVSSLFNDNAPPPPSSSGKTSDYFRPRSPAKGGD